MFRRIAKCFLWGARTSSTAQTKDVLRLSRATMRLSTIEGAVWAIMAGFGETYIQPFAVFLKASNIALAFLGTMPTLVGALAQRMGASLTERLGRRREPIVVAVTLQALCYLPMVVLPWLFPQRAVPAVLVFAALATAFGNLVAPAWLSMMSQVVPSEERGTFFGARSRVVIFVLFLSTLAAGSILGKCQALGSTFGGFAILFGVACVARLVSAKLLAGHYDPPCRSSSEDYFSFWDFLRRWPVSNFARFALGMALMHGVVNIAAPFFNVYFLRDLKWNYWQFTVNAAVFQAVQFLTVKSWGRVGDRYGNRRVVVTCAGLVALIPFLFTLSTNYVYILMVQVLAGLAWSGFALGGQNFMFDAVTPPKRARIVAYTSVLNGITTLLGGVVIGGALATHLPTRLDLGAFTVEFVSPLPMLFLVSGILRALGALLLCRTFREVKPVEPIHTASILLHLAGGEAVAGLLQQAIRRLPLSGRSREAKRAKDVA